ncbi:DUF2019 domain-containing protein [Pendulispora brunnea]|uniref:DUF2019 domain-containing protein n=1 Tax=Pendulispora brunnea TaxID=2905690 RepID=A0ABZ2K1B3_9BACT
METIEELLIRYQEAASKHGTATRSGASEEANEAHDLIAATYAEIRRRGEQRKLLPLLTDSDVGIRLWAAAHALEFAPEDGERVLQAIETGQHRLLSFSAKVTLQEWRAGRLKFA